MQLRQHGAHLALIALVALALGVAPGRPAARAATQTAPTRYIVTLEGPPPGALAESAAPSAAEAARDRALAALGATLGGRVAPIYVYTHALNGFAVELTPKEAAAAAALPGVADVLPETFSTYQTDRGPSLIGAADLGQRPALFVAPLAGAEGAAGRAAASYDSATRRLQIQVAYSGLGGAPAAELRLGAGGEAGALVQDLAGYAIGVAGGAGAYGGLLAPLDAAGEAALFAGRLFVRLDGPAGSIRGQLEPGGGKGIVVGVIDGGVNAGHPFFQDPAPDGFDHKNPLGKGVYLGVCSSGDGDGRYDPIFPCNDKLIGAYTYAETAPFPDPLGQPSPWDDNGHGSHTASTAVGNRVANAPGGTLAGVAPNASLIVYDVCGTATGPKACSSLAIVAAIDQAIANGVDVINYSIGRSSISPWGDAVAQAFLGAAEAGILVAVAAGNAGPGAGSIGSPSNAPWVLGVAASSLDRSFINGLGSLSGGSDALRPATIVGGGVALPSPGAATLVDAAALSPPNSACEGFSAAQADQVAGKIVVCDDLFGYGDAAPDAWEAGAAGAIFIAGDLAPDIFPEVVFTRPAVLVSAMSGAALRQWLGGCATCKAAIGGASLALDEEGDVIAGFSSRGPDRSVPQVLKPDVAAPGIAILAADADRDLRAVEYAIMSGTSMATPHASGLAAILRQIHPDWTPSEVKSAMMLTAEAAMGKEGSTAGAGPFDMGAGRISAAAALAGFVLDESAGAYRAAEPAAGGDPASLNLAGITSDHCLGACTFTRTLRSTLGTTVTWTIGASDGDGFTLSTRPAGSITLGPGARQTLVISASIILGSAKPAAYSFGRLTLSAPGGIAPAAGMPAALKMLRSTLEDPVEITALEPSGSLVVPVRSLATGELTAGTYGLARLSAQTVSLAADKTPDNIDDSPEGTYTRELLLPAGTTRLRAEIRRAEAPDMDLYILADMDGDGFKEALCAGNNPANTERCDLMAEDLVRGIAEALPVTILVQNYRGSGAPADRVELLFGSLGTTSAGGLMASAPRAVQTGELYDVRLGWDLGRPQLGDIYLAVLTLSSSRAAASVGDLGAVPVTISYTGHRLSLPLVGR